MIKNFLKTFSSFLPWVIFSFVSKFSYPLAFLSSIFFLAIFSFQNLKKGFILEWFSLLFFLLGFLNCTLVKSDLFSKYFSLSISVFFIFVFAFSLIIKKPITLQYAKLLVEEKFWSAALFLRINMWMTAGLGTIFFVIFLINLYAYAHPGSINRTFVWAIALPIKVTFIKKFPDWYKKRYLLKKQKEEIL